MTPIILLSGQARSGKDTAGAVFAKMLGGTCIALADPMKRFLAHAYSMSEGQLWGDSKEALFEPKLTGSVSTTGALAVGFTAALGDDYLESYDEEMSEVLISGLVAWHKSLPKVTTPRHMLQTLGTECVRQIDPDFWINYGLYVADHLLLGAADYDKMEGLTDLAELPIDAVVITDGRFRNEILPVKQAGGLCYRVKRDGVKVAQPAIAVEAKKHASEAEQQLIPDWWFDGVLENNAGLGEFQARARALAIRIKAPIYSGIPAETL